VLSLLLLLLAWHVEIITIPIARLADGPIDVYTFNDRPDSNRKRFGMQKAKS
jgi:hypothetical protein